MNLASYIQYAPVFEVWESDRGDRHRKSHRTLIYGMDVRRFLEDFWSEIARAEGAGGLRGFYAWDDARGGEGVEVDVQPLGHAPGPERRNG